MKERQIYVKNYLFTTIFSFISIKLLKLFNYYKNGHIAAKNYIHIIHYSLYRELKQKIKNKIE